MGAQLVNPEGLGVAPAEQDCYVIARGGNLSKGYCYPFAAIQSSVISADGVTLSPIPGNEGWYFGNASSTINTNDCRAGRFCIPLENILDGQAGKVRVRGLVKAFVRESNNTAFTVGAELSMVGGNAALNAVVATGGNTPRKLLAIALEGNSSTPSNATEIMIDFDGWDGIGSSGNV